MTASSFSPITQLIETDGSLSLSAKRVGILTSGGDAPGMNAVIAAAADRIERLDGVPVGVRSGFSGLAERRAAGVDVPSARLRASEPGTWLQTSRWPDLAAEEGRRICRDALEALELDGLIVIGGGGSAMGARALATAVPTAFVPATIDGDVAGTEIAVGTDSAIAYAVDVIERLRVTGAALPGRAFIVQTLGAPTGRLAAAVAAAAGVEEVLVPEAAADLSAVAARLQERARRRPAIVVMSEAIGDAVRVGEELAARSGVRVHPTILGHAQRAAAPSRFDRAVADAAGGAAADVVAARRSEFVALTRRGIATPRGLLIAAAVGAGSGPA